MIQLRVRTASVWKLGLALFFACLAVTFSAHAQSEPGVLGESHASQPSPEQLEFFEREIRPVLVEHCYECHSGQARKIQAGLVLDSRSALLKGGDSGPSIDLSDIASSPLLQAVRYEGYEMPPKGKLPDSVIASIEKWLEMGAPWPAEQAVETSSSPTAFDLEERKANHWVWQPIANRPEPAVSDAKWPQSPIDHFILAKLESAGVQPTVSVDRNALVRRLYLDLIGLPPTPSQVEEYLNDASADATKNLIDRLLESPHFGERWGRHWLDLMRFAESRGHEFDNDATYAYQYRDYVIRAFNVDVPYDQFVREHLAGDLLSVPRLHPTENFNESVLATGFFHLGEWVHSPVDIRKDESDRFDNMIDVMSKTFLGVTVACARCHDHKFDAISTEDYYALSGYLQSSIYREVPFDALEHNRAVGDTLEMLDVRHQNKCVEVLAQAAPKEIQSLSDLQQQYATAVSDPAIERCLVCVFDKFAAEIAIDGEVFGRRPVRLGEVRFASKDDQPGIQFSQFASVATDSFWNAFGKQEKKSANQQSTISNLPRAGRTYRTESFTLRDGMIHCRVRGQGHVVVCVDSHRLIAGPLHGDTVRAIPKSDSFQWIALDMSRYLGHRLHLEFNPDVASSLQIEMVTQGATPEQLSALEAIERDFSGRVSTAEATINAAIKSNESLSQLLTQRISNWAEDRAVLQQKIRTESRLAMSMIDGTGEDDHILIRGNSSKPGKVAERRFLAAVDGPAPMPIGMGSGRLQLAERINDPKNPLASRVIVNRIWHHLMGRGIVPTTDDFGVLGQRPTHPELLDHLATVFMNEGRSIKRMIRYIALSKTYQMASKPVQASIDADPKNMLWHYRPAKRLEGETIRDVLLSISGRLDEKMNGESIAVHLTSFMDGRGRPAQSGPVDGANRRSIYQEVRRNFLSPMMTTFDSPTPFSSMGRRNVSNVPAQALILMNDPLVVQLAIDWAKRSEELVPNTTLPFPHSRIQWMYRTAYARPASAVEIEAAIKFFELHSKTYGLNINSPELWADFAHALVNKKEFIFQR